MNNWLIDKGGIYVVIQFFLFGLIWLAPASVMAWSSLWISIGKAVGLPLLIYGFVMLSFGLFNLGRNLQAEPHPKDNATLVTHGAYNLVRHPIYSGIILGWTGWGLWQSGEVTAMLASVVLFIFFDIKTRREERMLMAKFPDYEVYRQRVKKLIPYVY